MVAYLDSSVVLEHILKGDKAISQALSCDRTISSELLEIECRRVLHRYRLQGHLDDTGFIQAVERLESVLNGVSLISMSSRVLKRAGQSFPLIIRTLDALHLSSAEIYREENPDDSVLLFTFDRQLNQCAGVMDYTVPFSASVSG
ncbi:MAG: type II toxin-antitoxin system VapC family toxin [Spirochaetaceae bacterium]|nr:type II toxin-antitoxin system VapC family toxin [Spirochaetaceae bacterium]MDT8298169.1 type II toxin-antitoxin system VapC family toxin [Spirochaetaceae bacterium]